MNDRWRTIRVVEKPTFGNYGNIAKDELYYSLDGKTILYNGYPVKGADFDSFVYCLDFAKDKKKCYRNGSAYKDADPDSFEVLNQYFARDKDFIYSLDGVVKNADYKTFEVLDCGYEMDNKGERKAILSYSSDKSGIWWSDYYSHKPTLIKSSDKNTFQRIDDSFAKDSKTVYWRGRKIAKANPNTFISLNENYGKDDKNIFCQVSTLTGADYETFSVSKEKCSVNLAWDKNHFYDLEIEIDKKEFDEIVQLTNNLKE